MTDQQENEQQEIELEEASNKQDEPQTYGNYFFSGMVTALCKYLPTAVLAFMATSHYSLLGFVYCLLFLYHTVAYYGCRVSDKPIDFLVRKSRPYKVNLRSSFVFLFVVVSTLAFLLVILLKIMLAVSGKD